MGTFRHPKTQRERKGDQALQHDGGDSPATAAGRVRSGRKGGGLPTERDDKVPASRSDRARGKKSHSSARKAKSKARDDLLA